jgi:hypothetical protein
MMKRTAVAFAVAALTLPVVMQAQETATITLRSGEKLNGQLVDMGGSGFAVRVNGQDRQIPTGDVAVIDFSGGGDVSEADWSKVTGGSNVIWLRNGQTITGQLHDISGTSPLKITFKTDSGERALSSSEIGRIVLARPGASGVAATTGGQSQVPTGEGVAVAANQQWTPTNITVRRGEVLTFNTTGEARLGGGGETARASGTGTDRKIANAPLPQVPPGALIAKVGNGEPFPIGGPTATVTMPAAGQLFLGLNDDHVGDNEGGFRVSIQRQNRRR